MLFFLEHWERPAEELCTRRQDLRALRRLGWPTEGPLPVGVTLAAVGLFCVVVVVVVVVFSGVALISSLTLGRSES